MITTPTDPVQDIIDFIRRFALQLMDECPTIGVGMSIPNQIVTPQLFYERLDTEDVIRRRVAQYRNSLQLVTAMRVLCASLFAAKRV